MAVTTCLSDVIRQVAAEAMAPSGAVIKAILVKVGAAGTYNSAYNTAYTTGLGGDECPTANGYTQGGLTLTGRSAGVITTSYGWVDYADAVWTAVGALSAIACGFWDSTNSRWVGWQDFGGTKTATDAAFTVAIPGDAGSGGFRV
jgi:hypothetical protein